MRYAQKPVKHLEGESYCTYDDIPKENFKCFICGKMPDHFKWTTPMWPDRPLGENKFFHLDCMAKTYSPEKVAEIMRRNSNGGH